MTAFSSIFLGVWGVFVVILIKESTPVYSWNDWWSYDGNSGPLFWSMKPEWRLCEEGKRQSPINIEHARVTFKSTLLQPLHLDEHRINGVLANTGHGVVFTVENDTRHPVKMSGGTLDYHYQFHEIHLHFGSNDSIGSEHTIDGRAFPVELQIFGFNSQLYNNFSDALHREKGIVAVSLLLQVGNVSNPELQTLTQQLDKIKYKGQTVEIKHFGVRELVPDTNYMTYNGSITMPACHESTTWIIMSRPIYITNLQLHALRQLRRNLPDYGISVPLANNFRPPQPLHDRIVWGGLRKCDEPNDHHVRTSICLLPETNEDHD
ncbi:PREDICTED: carbonic anhydrase-related protein 10-like [Wasmannia auropunctata]|uniref:carbonic anhydrase-related protein 10-like n=1 Tax=Wasmannia auropunctata TaxID=64793 RepID=UPI0005EF72C3|nr:PREDICTED: carbonic anhydrase-related protein 10-like [Wasmannia auropunctata]